jgi:methylmalonyl-CoA mutase C-terminal domain/subunit
MTLVPKIVELLRAEGAGDVLVVVGGTIPPDDSAALLEQGVAAVYTPGQPVQDIVDFLELKLAGVAG